MLFELRWREHFCSADTSHSRTSLRIGLRLPPARWPTRTCAGRQRSINRSEVPSLSKKSRPPQDGGKWPGSSETLPAHSLAQLRNVRDMVPRVPCVEQHHELHCHRASYGVMKGHTLPLVFVQGLEQHYPTGVQVGEQSQGPGHRGRRIGKRRPALLAVLKRSRIFRGKPQPETHKGNHMAVCNVVHHLPYRPASLAVRCVELLMIESIERSGQTSRQLRQRCDGGPPVLRLDCRRPLEPV